MTINFNVDPYYDDFDPAKNFHRILFKPGKAVQARELTQSQSILQDQVTKFADNIFKQNSPVTGGQVTTNFDCYYLKLQSTYNNTTIDVTKFENLLVKSQDGTVIARVIAVADAVGEEPPTLILSYKTGSHFTDNDIIYDTNSNLAAQAIVSNATGKSSVASIAEGVFYILGNFVQVSASTVILEKYSNTPSKRIGLEITETIYDYIDDPSLLDPAIGASNYQAPGADRYVIALTLSTRTIELGDDQNFVELVRVVSGDVQRLVDGSVYNVIDDYFAKRDYETNGDYIVNDFKLTPKTNADSSKYTMSIGKGLAYVHGYRVENEIQQDIVSNRARTTGSQNNDQIFIDYGSYFYVDNVRGANASFFNTSNAQTIDLHCIAPTSVNTSNSMVYSSTKVGTGYIRGLVYDGATDTSSGNTFIYKAFVHDVQLNTPSSNATSGSANTITLPAHFSATSNAYLGVDIQITNGTSAGDFRTITSYNGTTKVATVNQNWTTTPDTTSQFVMNFNIADVETIMDYDSGTKTVYGTAKINSQSKLNGLSTNDTVMENPTVPEMIFKVGVPYVATLTDGSYTSQHLWKDVVFNVSGGTASAQLNYEGATDGVYYHLGVPGQYQSADVVRQNYTIIVTDPGSNTNLVRGDIIQWTSSQRKLLLDVDGSKATLSATDISYSFTADIIAKVSISNANDTGYVLKYKNLIEANTSVVFTGGTQVNTHTFVDNNGLLSTGQIYIENSGLVTPGSKQSLYLSDVKRIVKILDTVTNVLPSTVNMSNYVDVTNRYSFDNGQRDCFYDHASITLKPGAKQPKGNLLVYVDYYHHTGGDGYFSVYSYLNSSKPEDYTQIPSYTSTHGTTYFLRDSLDFRPVRQNANANFTYLINNNSLRFAGANLPIDLTTFRTDYTYYLGRKDKLILSKDKTFKIIEGAPSLTPLVPTEPDGSLVLANITHRPYTGYIPSEAPFGTMSDLSVEKVQHKRFTMQDISNIENRVNNIEYYTSLSLLEQKASTLQISDAYGLNRFKNGIMVDDFSSFATADTSNQDFNASINRRDHVMTAAQNVMNFPLKSIALVSNNGALANSVSASLGYTVKSDGKVNYFTRPYTTANVASQKFASRTVNANPFSFTNKEGQLYITPNVDNWVDTNYAPSLLITDPNMQVFQSTDSTKNLMSVGDWKTIPGTTTYTDVKKVNHTSADWGYGVGIGEETKTWTYQQQATATYGSWKSLGNSFSLDNGFITDVSIQPYIRSAEVAVRGYDMLLHTDVDIYFDGLNVNGFVRKPNIIELTGVTGKFKEDDIIGYYSGGSFHQTGIVLGVYQKDTTTVRLYVAGDPNTTTYNNGLILKNAFFNTSGTYVNSTATGTVVSTEHFGGRVRTANSSTMIQLSSLASSANSYYVGNTIYFCNGTGSGESAVIDAYYGANQTAHLSTSVTFSKNDIYSIGDFKTDEIGSVYGIFNIPENTFHNGQRVLRIDNSNGNKGSETTYCESTYYAEGLQTTQIGVDFASSPSAAKNTFTKTITRWKTDTVKSAWDPLCQTFIFDTQNYPNGLFLDAINLFFATKPTKDSLPITLSIVGTLNGYPNGQTLDHSIVTLTPDKVVTSNSPHYLDDSSKTTFRFNAPVFLQPGVLYAFMLKSNSSEYTLWSASNGDTALASSVKNLPSDPLPSTITKIGSAPYVGGIFMSQNSQTWTADQNQSLMFVLDRCVFDTSSYASLSFVVPKKLPQRTFIDQSIDYLNDANTIVAGSVAYSNTNILVDAFNVTTTDLIPTTTGIDYSYNATLVNGNSAGSQTIIPGKFGTPTNNDLYLNDGKGERVLDANTNSSFTLNAVLTTTSDAVSPMISDAGLTTYAIQWSINNCGLSNNQITVTSGGSSYNVSNTLVTFSAPDIGSDTATGVANVVNGVVDAVYVTYPGSGYITTPTVSISVTGGSATGATATVSGETSKSGGNALARYVTKKVVLDQGFDSGDLNVYLTAYRPVNTNIHVYYKILNRNDTQKFDDGSWQLMTKTNNSDSKYSQARDDLIEYTFAPGTNGVDQGYVSYTSVNGQTYSSFSQFAIKVVFTTSDNTFVPFATDLRAIALPSNVNTTF